MTNSKVLSSEDKEKLITIVSNRFKKNLKRHPNLDWSKVRENLENKPDKLWSLNEMELSGGEPDVVAYDKETNEFVFYDCSAESPKGRRSLCYDNNALESRKEYKPKNSAIGIAEMMQIEILNEEQYKELQKLGEFDLKTSSWIKTPTEIRNLGGALFCDRRYNEVFVYHNGAESYYAARGFRGLLRI